MSRKAMAERVVNTLENAVRGRQILVLGSPRSGKTAFLHLLSEEISARNRNWFAFMAGPATSLMSPIFFQNLVVSLKREGCLNSQFDIPDRSFSLSSFFRKLSPALYKEMLRHVVILVDDLDQNLMPLDQISNLLSSIRAFYTEWQEIDINVHFIFTGNVNPRTLLSLYKDADSASWPLEHGKTIIHLPRLTVDEVGENIKKTTGDLEKKAGLYSSYLFELTNGDTHTIAWILSGLARKPPSCQMMFETAEGLVDNGDWINILRLNVSRLSAKAVDVLTKILQGHFVCVQDHELREELILSGLFYETEFKTMYLLNPILERSLRKHWNGIKPKDAPETFGDLSEMLPPVFCLNTTAFELISEIEMLLRNLVVIRLGTRTEVKHLLSGLNYEINARTGVKEDQYYRSSDWRKRVGKSRFVDAHAALISYTDTKDLLGLFDYLINNEDEVLGPLKPLRPQLYGMKEIRDAVMHGQVINEKSVDNLFRIHSQLTTALTINA